MELRIEKSLRGFKPTPVPEETIRNTLEMADRSPSYTNTQPWEVAMVRSDSTKLGQLPQWASYLDHRHGMWGQINRDFRISTKGSG